VGIRGFEAAVHRDASAQKGPEAWRPGPRGNAGD